MTNKVLAEIYRVTSDKAIIRVPVRKEVGEALSALKPYNSAHGKFLESEVVAMFNAAGFNVSATKLIMDEDKVSYKVYVVTKFRPTA